MTIKIILCILFLQAAQSTLPNKVITIRKSERLFEKLFRNITVWSNLRKSNIPQYLLNFRQFRNKTVNIVCKGKQLIGCCISWWTEKPRDNHKQLVQNCFKISRVCLHRSWSWSLPNFVWMNISGYQNYRSSLFTGFRAEKNHIFRFCAFWGHWTKRFYFFKY
jgi:hypothetical protein